MTFNNIRRRNDRIFRLSRSDNRDEDCPSLIGRMNASDVSRRSDMSWKIILAEIHLRSQIRSLPIALYLRAQSSACNDNYLHIRFASRYKVCAKRAIARFRISLTRHRVIERELSRYTDGGPRVFNIVALREHSRL